MKLIFLTCNRGWCNRISIEKLLGTFKIEFNSCFMTYTVLGQLLMTFKKPLVLVNFVTVGPSGAVCHWNIQHRAWEMGNASLLYHINGSLNWWNGKGHRSTWNLSHGGSICGALLVILLFH